MAGSFRADRYASLLGGELLPATPPFADRRRRRLWQQLRQVQRDYQEAKDSIAISAERWREIAARNFSRLVIGLHGGKLPWWLQGD